jgi:hypothetical protein
MKKTKHNSNKKLQKSHKTITSRIISFICVCNTGCTWKCMGRLDSPNGLILTARYLGCNSCLQ